MQQDRWRCPLHLEQQRNPAVNAGAWCVHVEVKLVCRVALCGRRVGRDFMYRCIGGCKKNTPTTPCYTIPHYTTPHYTTPHQQHHITPCHTAPHHTTPHHATPHHTNGRLYVSCIEMVLGDAVNLLHVEVRQEGCHRG